jgi:hypothetical protein
MDHTISQKIHQSIKKRENALKTNISRKNKKYRATAPQLHPPHGPLDVGMDRSQGSDIDVNGCWPTIWHCPGAGTIVVAVPGGIMGTGTISR